MPKLQELFVKPDSSKLLDTKLLMEVIEVPTEPTIETSDDGTRTYENFYVKLAHQGQEYDFKCSAAQLARIFQKTKKTGEVYWQAKSGDRINFWYASNKSNPQRPYFAAEPVSEDDTVANAQDVFTQAEDGEMKPVVQTAPVAPAKKTFAKSNATFRKDGAKTGWDGTPRQSSFRQGLAGMLQAFYSNPNVNPLDAEHRAAVKAICDEEVEYVRHHAKELEASITA